MSPAGTEVRKPPFLEDYYTRLSGESHCTWYIYTQDVNQMHFIWEKAQLPGYQGLLQNVTLQEEREELDQEFWQPSV